jgi:hypothetical protein
MNIEAQPLGNEYRFDGQESNIVEVFDSLSGLRITVSTWTDSINEALLQVYFRRVHGYRFLDELDLIAYWKTEKFGLHITSTKSPKAVGLRGNRWKLTCSIARGTIQVCGNGSSLRQMVV